MGFSRWSDDFYRQREKERRLHNKPTFAHDAAMREKPRDQRVCHQAMNPYGVRARESRDSEAHPESLAVAVLFDVTGSMGSIPVTLQKKLPELMGLLVRKGYVDHPQVLFGAVGDATCDGVPLQIGQFESGNEMQNDIERLYLEGGGGGYITESYELGLYFLARHTSIDCWEKREHKGYAFLIGDELPYDAVKRDEVKALIGEVPQADIPVRDIVAELQQRYEVYYLIPSGASHGNNDQIRDTWRKLLGQNVLHLNDPAAVCETIALQIGIAEGRTNLEEGLSHLAELGVGQGVQKAVAAALVSDAGGATEHPARSSRKGGTRRL